MSKAPHRAPSAPSSRDQEIAGPAPGLNTQPLSAADTARYVAEFSAELSYLARRARLDLLAYLLDMARLEASRAMHGGTPVNKED